MKETDLYPPVRDYLEKQGYQVNAEVNGCDVTARKENELIIIELKTSFSLQLIYQAIDRQSLADSVYVAIPVRKGKKYPPHFREMKGLCRRLELGLILLVELQKGFRLEIVFHPDKIAPRKNRKKQKALIREINGRVGELNTGGSVSKGGRMTLYRQRAVQIAVYLDRVGEASPSELVKMGSATGTQGILGKNFYGWFVRIKRGRYCLHPDGKKALESYPQWKAHFEADSP